MKTSTQTDFPSLEGYAKKAATTPEEKSASRQTINKKTETLEERVNRNIYCEVRLSRSSIATPEQNAKKLFKNRERTIKCQPMETPEQTEEREGKQSKNRCQRKRKPEAPEEKAERLLKRRERYKLKRSKETPEQAAERRLKTNCRPKPKPKIETPEQIAKRMLKKIEFNRIQREMRKMETPEQSEARRAKCRKHTNNHRQRKRTQETPEERAERLLKGRERHKIYYSMATPEEAAERLLKRNQRMKMNLKIETPEQSAERRAIRREQVNKYRARNRAKVKSKETKIDTFGFKANSSEKPIVKYENIDDAFDESCTWSSFGGSAGIYNQTSINRSCSQTTITTEDNLMMQYNSDATSEVKSDPSGYTSFIYDVFEIDPATNKEIINNDERSNKITEIKYEIDASDHSIAPAIMQDNIVKEELDL